MALDLGDLRSIVTNHHFDRLIGELESEFLDVKSQPYRFDPGLDAKREFAKDVSAFANANGGYILLGFTTKVAAARAGEEISGMRPFENALFDADRHHKILSEWLYPQPKDIGVEWLQYGTDQAKGIGVIFVPAQAERSKPFLIRRAIGDKKSIELLIGYAERRRDRTDVRNIVEIHQALRMGLNFERELLGRIANIETLVERHFSARIEAETAEKREKLLHQRIARVMEEARSWNAEG